MTKKTPSFDCVQAKRKAQAEIYETIKDRSPREQIDFFETEAASGPLGSWWKRLRTAKQTPSSPETS